jgi:multimeric flavodoxin WrbA
MPEYDGSVKTAKDARGLFSENEKPTVTRLFSMNVLYISGSPRKNSNTDYLLKEILSVTGGEFLKITDYRVDPCRSCWTCVKSGKCAVDDDMSERIIPMLLKVDMIVLGTPVYFNNVSAQLKAFMDRTWCIKGKLRNKVGGAIVVGRRDGAESAITAIHAFFLKHEMIPANRGVHGRAYGEHEIAQDPEALESAKNLGERLIELGAVLGL